jgi:Spy/CpxP family protein refolding chaperone
MHINRLVARVAVVLALAAPAAAGEDRSAMPVTHEELSRAFDELAGQLHGLGERWRGHFSQGQPGERPLISIMLSHRDELGLSVAQVQELERLRGEFQKQAIKHDAALRVAEMDLTALLTKDTVDMATAEAKVREIERLRADLRLDRIRTIEQGKALLTPEQRGKLAGVLSDPWAFRPRTGESRPPRALPHNL